VTALGDEALAHDVTSLRDALSLDGRTTPKPFDFAASYDLYKNLLGPLAPSIAKGKSLIVVESGILGQLPLAVLVKAPVEGNALEGAPWLVRDVSITHVASASAWTAVRGDKRRISASQPFLGFGAPDFGSHVAIVPPLPETRGEVEAAAKALNADLAQSSYFGSAATREAVLRAPLATRRVVEFATHGLRAGELPTLSQPALAMADAGPNQPWLLTLDDVLKLKLSAQLVVLSACNTASSDGSSAESISGLGRGFFFAGSHAVLLTHWEVETDAAKELVTDFFTARAEGSGSWADALRAAQLKMMSGPNVGLHHPVYWAPYALIGDGSS
jgi:CHAT domain-containing protein